VSAVPEPPETVQITNCGVLKVELPDGAMLLCFVIPGIRRYDFALDAKGREVVAQLCQHSIPTFGPGDMPRNAQ
jgi:hypothetical protein